MENLYTSCQGKEPAHQGNRITIPQLRVENGYLATCFTEGNAAMKTFRVLVRGSGVLLEAQGIPRRLGFYTTRVVSAARKAAAVEIAIKGVEEELRGRVKNDSVDRPSLVAEEIEEIASEPASVTPGFSFFEEEGLN